jgi:hypothetical protein
MVELARSSGVSVRTIARLEAGDETVTDVTKNKILIGLGLKSK